MTTNQVTSQASERAIGIEASKSIEAGIQATKHRSIQAAKYRMSKRAAKQSASSKGGRPSDQKQLSRSELGANRAVPKPAKVSTQASKRRASSKARSIIEGCRIQATKKPIIEAEARPRSRGRVEHQRQAEQHQRRGEHQRRGGETRADKRASGTKRCNICCNY
jgi:hypothetical protein